MARHKEFERDTALSAAIVIFSEHGYEGTSTDDLLKAMKISRQSMYDTFGDKRRLYLEALQRYNSESVLRLVQTIKSQDTPADGLEVALLAFASRSAEEASRCCLGVSAICEFGRTDTDVSLLTDNASRTLMTTIETVVRDGIAAGAFNSNLNVTDTAHFLGAALSGMKVSARDGASPETLRAIVRMALRSLT
jgi:TetR/AcrR family transcriptional repressor of nem operon